MYGFQSPGNQIKNNITYNSGDSVMPAANKTESGKDLWTMYKKGGNTDPQSGSDGGGGGFNFSDFLKNNAGGILKLLTGGGQGASMVGGGGMPGGGMPGIAGILSSLFKK